MPTQAPSRPASLLRLLLATSLLAGCAQDPAARTASPPSGPSAMTPYLGAGRPDGLLVLPPPPAPASPAQRLDEIVFTHSRALRERDPQRWALARNDAQLDFDHLMADFACALQVRLDRISAPTLYRLLARLALDSRPETDAVKDHYDRRRPYIGNDAPICIARGTGLDATASYPSGHTTIGWTLALLLTELAQDRAGEILARGRAFGESRIVCGVHWLSDVQAGTLNGATLVAAVHSSPGFRADMLQAGREIAAARRDPRPADPAMCAAEADAERHSPLFALQP